jgi:chromosomal replication initiation ATPase DnaA
MTTPVRTQNDASILEALDLFMREHPPTPEDVLAAACETYSVDPSEIHKKKKRAASAQAAFCFFAVRWCGESLIDIGHYVKLDHELVNRLGRSVGARRHQDMILRDDLDLMTLRIADWVMLRRHNNGRLSAPLGLPI